MPGRPQSAGNRASTQAASPLLFSLLAQVFQLQVCDPSLSQDELQCAVNAALYSPAPPPSFEHWSLAAEPIGMQELGYELGGVKRARV